MVVPKQGKPKQLVVFLHGYGSDGNDLISLARLWQKDLPDALFVAPNAPARCDINPAGYQWFALDVDRVSSRISGAQEARRPIEEFLADLWRQTGLGARQTLLVGFSQGGMMALDVGLRLKESLMGIVSFSGGLIGAEDFATELKSRPPVCLVHGRADDVVPFQMSQTGAEVLQGLGVRVALQLENGIGHTISMQGLGFALAFMREIGAGTQS